MKELKFVDVGEGITEGHIQKWLVKDGDTVKEDQSIAQIETDKAVVNLPAPVSGIIKIIAKEDSIVHVGDTICFVGAPEEVKSALPSQKAAPQPQRAAQTVAAQQKAAPQPKTKEIIATPSVRKLARDLNVDISNVSGTGPGGKIVEDDVRRSVGRAPKQGAPGKPQSGNVERVPMSQTRKAIARNMEESWKTPRATHMDLIEATGLWNLVSKEKQQMQKMDVHLTFLPFIIKALIEALKENPHFNASYDRDAQEIIVKKYYNIGLAAESEDGLKVMVIKDADKKSIVQIAKDIQELGRKVKDKTITLDEMKDASITITNIGSLGGGFLAVPMINPPNVAIIGILSIRDWPFAEGGNVVIGKILPFTITFDHRVVDGAEAVKLGNTIKKCLEDINFLEMLG
jgi:pyruvate dehydrogenase E2 component (dihydrolipoamide acetyltransferase)